MRAKVNRKAAIKEPYLVWNAFIDVLAMGERNELSPIQIAPHLSFWYDSEVQNGGHLQYFLNRGIDEAREALGALASIGADAQREILVRAIEYYTQSGIDNWETADEYDALWRQGHFEEHDLAYHDCVPEMTELLQRYLDVHTEDFIEYTDRPVRDRYELTWHNKLYLRIRRFLGLMP